MRNVTSKRVAIIGGIPEPIGGVTTFIHRLAEALDDSRIIVYDVYPASIKAKLSNTQHLQFQGWQALLSHYAAASVKLHTLFFNFSTLKGLLLPFLMKPFRSGDRWVLLLHHGRLAYPSVMNNIIFRFIIKNTIRSFHEILYLNTQQYEFFSSVLTPNRLKKVGTFIRPTYREVAASTQDFVAELQQTYAGYLISSGYATPLYRHVDMITTLGPICQKENYAYLIFIYGQADEAYYQKMQAIVTRHPHVKLVSARPANEFDFILRQAAAYIRNTESDSFGIALHDALYHGIPTYASDACERPEGVRLFHHDQELATQIYDLLHDRRSKPNPARPFYERDWVDAFRAILLTDE